MTLANHHHEQGKNVPHYEDKNRHDHRNRNEKQIAGEEQKQGKFSPGQSPDYNPEDFNTD